METAEALEKHLELVLRANKLVNLTRINSIEEGRLLHIEDSLAALQEMEEAPDGLYGDMGTGGGYPGIPLALATGRKTVLIDSTKKKIDILKFIVEELKLQDQVTTYCGRLEDLAKSKKQSFAVLTARALSQLVSLTELASPLLEKGGRLICYKGQLQEKELDAAVDVQRQTGMKLVSVRNLMLSDNETHRCIVVFEKAYQPSLKLPRRVGLAQTKPLTREQ